MRAPVLLGRAADFKIARNHSLLAVQLYQFIFMPLFTGMGIEGQLGYGDTRNIGGSPDITPLKMPPLMLGEKALYISAGYKHTCALLESGNVRCWGKSFNAAARARYR